MNTPDKIFEIKLDMRTHIIKMMKNHSLDYVEAFDDLFYHVTEIDKFANCSIFFGTNGLWVAVISPCKELKGETNNSYIKGFGETIKEACKQALLKGRSYSKIKYKKDINKNRQSKD